MTFSDEGDTGVVRVLLALGADPNATTGAPLPGSTPLTFAAGEAHAGVVLALLHAGADPNVTNSRGVTPLCLALHMAGVNEQVVRALLDAGARTDFPDRDHSSLGCFLPYDARRVEWLKLLLAHGGSVNDRFWPGKPHFVYWARCCPDLLEVLLDNGADVNMTSSDGRTALMQAALHGATGSAILLLSRGADPSLRDTSGRTALDFARTAMTTNQFNASEALPWRLNDPLKDPAYQAIIELLTSSDTVVSRRVDGN